MAYEGSVYTVTPQGDLTVTMKDRGMMSAGDGVRYVHVPGVAELRTAQTARLMRLLRDNRMLTAYREQTDDTTILCDEVEMFPIEVVIRAAAMGSYLQRNPGPELWFGEGNLTVEFFHKRSIDLRDGTPKLVDGNTIRNLGPAEVKRLQDERLVYGDPYVLQDFFSWLLYDAHAPIEGPALLTIPAPLDVSTAAAIKASAKHIFGLISDAFRSCSDLWLADMKLECGRRKRDGALVLADVINLDSMRLLRGGKFGKANQVSKQVFRDGADLETVLNIYREGLAAIAHLPT